MAEPYATTGSDTEQTVESISEMATIENVASISSKPSENIAPAMPSRTIVPTTPELPNVDTSPTQPTPQRISSRQRKASLDEYRESFMTIPKIIDRQPVFVSRQTHDSIDSIVRRLGERKMSVSGFLENLARHHLELYADDLEQWKRL